MRKKYYVIKATARGEGEEELSLVSSHHEAHDAMDAAQDANDDYNKPSYEHYFASQYRPEETP